MEAEAEAEALEEEVQKQTTTAAADTSSEVARKIKEQFRKQASVRVFSSFSSSFCVLSLISEFTIFGEIFVYVTLFCNPTIEVVTFHLHGWCMLGVLLLLVFTHLGHECQDLLCLCDGMHVCTDKTSVYTVI